MSAPEITLPKTVVVGAVFLVDKDGQPIAENAGDYEAVAASQTDQVLGADGAIGDVLSSMLVTPATTSPGAISIKDGGGSSMTIFAGGSSSVADLKPFTIFINLTSVNGAWKVTTGTNVSLVASGDFT
jgi:hypothetical protein